MDIPYSVKMQCCSLLLSVYFHKVALLQHIIAGSKIIIFSGAGGIFAQRFSKQYMLII